MGAAIPPPTRLDRVLAYLAPQWAWRRAQARAGLLRQQADAADPTRVRERHGERWQRVDAPGQAPFWELRRDPWRVNTPPPPPARPSFWRRR